MVRDVYCEDFILITNFLDYIIFVSVVLVHLGCLVPFAIVQLSDSID
jgi:hypothetical protein